MLRLDRPATTPAGVARAAAVGAAGAATVLNPAPAPGLFHQAENQPATVLRLLDRGQRMRGQWDIGRARDPGKAAILRKYFIEMELVLSEIYRVLRADSPAIVVVGTSTMRDIDVQTHQCLADIAAEIGFDVVGVVQRVLDRNKRMMPARFGKKTDSMIEQRIHEEYVIGLLKPNQK